MLYLISPILAFALTAASAVAMIVAFVAFVAGFDGWTVMASGLALTTGALWLYSEFESATAHR